jgi:D-alanyl-D-alanine carboxypeptidase
MGALASPGLAVSDPDDHESLRSGLANLVQEGAVGAWIEVQDQGRAWRSSAGTSQLGTTKPVLEHSRFRVGSTTKAFTATVIMQLVDEGSIALDDPVSRWLPRIPNSDHITVRHLLGHTSGLYDSFRTIPRPPSAEFIEATRRTWTPEELIGRATEHPPVFTPPGSGFSYSNTNYTILGIIIERVTGLSYREAIDERIIRPLHLRGTTLPGSRTRIDGVHAHGYVPLQQGDEVSLVDFTEMNPSIMGAAGEIISTTRDLNVFFDALLAGDLVTPERLAEMKRPSTPGGRYGLGLWIHATSCGTVAYGHDGDAMAYQSVSFTSEDGSHQVTLALTPTFQADLDDAVETLVDDALCS